LRFGVLCRFTAYVAVDSRVVNEDGETRRVTQPVELPSGWEVQGAAATPMLMSAAPPMPPQALGAARPQFASPRATFARGSAAAPMDGVPRSGAPKTFAAIPSSMTASGRSRKAVAPTSSGLSLEDVRQLAALEAGRLHEAANRAAYDRRDMLADLSSRLGVLLDGLTDPAYAPLHALFAYLNAGDDELDARWAEATAVLEAFGQGHTAPGKEEKPEKDRKAFWKR
jgi:Ca-activated chloride channel family protein